MSAGVGTVRAQTITHSGTRVAIWIGGLSVLFALALAYSTMSFAPFDEAWFLQVVARLRHGEVLYRDVQYGAGPLPVYATLALSAIFGLDIIAVKLVVVAAFTATGALAWVVLRRLGSPPAVCLVAVSMLLFAAPPLPLSPYGTTAPFVLAALLAALVWDGASTVRLRTAAALSGGGACGLCFVWKQNVGLAAAAALILAFATSGKRDALKAVAAGVVGFFAAALPAIVPVLISGGGHGYLVEGFTGKGTYLAKAGYGYGHALALVRDTVRATPSEASAEHAFWASAVVLPLIGLAALLALACSRHARRNAAARAVALFALASAVSMYPRADAPHIYEATPMIVVLCAVAFETFRRRVRAVVAVVAVGVSAAAVLLIGTYPIRFVRSPSDNLSAVPHFRGSFASLPAEQNSMAAAARLSMAARRFGNRMFILAPDASFFYLTAGISNPTRFDYPLVTAFGARGQQEVERAIAAGKISAVCVSTWAPPLEPTALVAYVERTMQRTADLGACSLYVRRSAAS